MARSTREAILTATAELMRSKGYAAVGMKEIAAASGAPIGSLYHHFRGGKVQIAREALVNAGIAYGMLIPTVVDDYDDLGAAVEGVFRQAADDMAQTRFANMCPVASVSAEIADSVDELRRATADIFTGWIEGGTAYFAARGVDDATAREVAVALIGGLEGGFLLARALRDTEPLRAAGRALAPRFRGIPLARADGRVPTPARR
ncbi:TetR/AcrR family transcriptional regulator [Mycobacterium sp. Y57]|uniref:TetR/AcrR family transcriptional regulator n=1 Tax=Mycolicibacterium xanthum TaxID=2796469 RepID=UPI001C852EC4|nr:TetR/AcrR family transcriptional regulator [Mycolicibacterium xanthum]MBX7434086.1 TetR/AcrR family transcriptional regulator [Mycolicibacterium xanthum]